MHPTLLIVDDHPGFREYTRGMLLRAGFDVVGEAADGESALAAVAELRPDIVLLDVQLPGIDGFEVAARLAGPGGPRVVMTSTRDASDYAVRLTGAPICGFIPKAKLSATAMTTLLDAPVTG